MQENNITDVLLEESTFIIHEARWAEVTDEWKNFVSIYPYNRLYLVTEGNATINLKDTVLKLEPGYCYFLPSFDVVTANCEHSMVHYFIHFQTQLQSSHSLMDYFNLPYKIKANNMTLTLFQTAVANRLQQNMTEIFYLTGALRLLLAPFFQNLTQKYIETPRLKLVIDYVQKNLHREILIPELAQQMNLTVNYFSYLFKNSFGISPKKYILQKKLDRAQVLLSDKQFNINEIAYQLGFDNETYFSRLFKLKFNMSPTQYRAQFL